MYMEWGSHDPVEVGEMGDILAMTDLDFSQQVEALLEMFPISREEEEAQLARIDAEHDFNMLMDAEYRNGYYRAMNSIKNIVQECIKRG